MEEQTVCLSNAGALEFCFPKTHQMPGAENPLKKTNRDKILTRGGQGLSRSRTEQNSRQKTLACNRQPKPASQPDCRLADSAVKTHIKPHLADLCQHPGTGTKPHWSTIEKARHDGIFFFFFTCFLFGVQHQL